MSLGRPLGRLGLGRHDALRRKGFDECHIQGVGRAHPVGKWLEHVGFGHKAVDVAHRSVPAEVARTLEVGVPALLRRGAPVVHVRNHRESRILHSAVDLRLKLVAQKVAHGSAQLLGLGAQKGHDVLVVGAIAHVVVDQHQRIHPFDGADQAAGLGGVGLHEVAVEVEVLAVSAGAKLARTVLVHPVVGAALQHSANVEARNHRQHHIRRELYPALRHVAHEHHARVDAVGLARMDSVVDQHRHFAFGGPLVRI